MVMLDESIENDRKRNRLSQVPVDENEQPENHGIIITSTDLADFAIKKIIVC